MREDIIASAVNFLQDPNVAASPLEKRIAFLQSKNLTAEEVNVALQRVGEGPIGPGGMVPFAAAPGSPPAAVVSPGPNPYGGGYFMPGVLAQRPNEVPQRDWRDWFIMATVTGGVGYGIFHLAKRYVYPLISPPTPAQLTQDKASIDAEFTRAFSLLDQLSADTTALKSAEEARTARVDTCLEEVERVVEQLKETAKRREDEGKRVGEEVRSLRDLIPKALEGQKEAQAQALSDLQSELKSLKSLVMNRTGATRPSYLPTGPPPLDPGSAAASSSSTPLPQGNTNSTVLPASVSNTSGQGQTFASSSNPSAPGMGGMMVPRKDSTSPLPFGGMGKPAIPAWQMSAALKAQQAQQQQGGSSSGEGAAGSS